MQPNIIYFLIILLNYLNHANVTAVACGTAHFVSSIEPAEARSDFVRRKVCVDVIFDADRRANRDIEKKVN